MENNKQYESLRIKLQKLQALAERGEEGEALNARRAIERICADMGLNMDEVLDTTKKKEYRFEIGKLKDDMQLFIRCLEQCVDISSMKYHKPTRSSICVEVTAMEYADILGLFNWHKANFENEKAKMLKSFFSAYVSKHDLYFAEERSSDGKSLEEFTSEELESLRRTFALKRAMGDATYHKMLEAK